MGGVREKAAGEDAEGRTDLVGDEKGAGARIRETKGERGERGE